MRRWTEAEIHALEAHYANPISDFRVLEARLKRTRNAIWSKACGLGVSAEYRSERRRSRARPPRFRPSSSVPSDPVLAALVTARNAAGLTLGDLGKRTGYDASRLSRYERGKHIPGMRVLRDWAEALGLELRLIAKA
jgi:ribosome-binding protein aMBF1 (putative translation factor)